MSCSGADFAGQLGDGSTTDRSTPVMVPGLAGATALAAGDYHTCVVIGSSVEGCWGDNDNGQVGDGTTAIRHIPVWVLTNR